MCKLMTLGTLPALIIANYDKSLYVLPVALTLTFSFFRVYVSLITALAFNPILMLVCEGKRDRCVLCVT